MSEILEIVELVGKITTVGNTPIMVGVALLIKRYADKTKEEIVEAVDERIDDLKIWAGDRFVVREEFKDLETRVAVTEATCDERHKEHTRRSNTTTRT